MCGIVAAVSDRDISAVLMEGLRRLEYRGYDSAGIAFLNGGIQRVRKTGKVSELRAALKKHPHCGHIGIAHTRWATHGVADEINAHPHISSNRVVVVHNGIIENYRQLKAVQLREGFTFDSETDTEVIAHQVMLSLRQTDHLLEAVAMACRTLEGAYALGVLDKQSPDCLVAARNGSPLVIGVDDNGNYISSDVHALLPLTQDFLYMNDGEVALLKRQRVQIFDLALKPVPREIFHVNKMEAVSELGGFKHYMHKEIHEQPQAVADTLEGRLLCDSVPDTVLGADSVTLLDKVRTVHMVGCGTSYHAALVAKYWFENLVGIPCPVEIASEFRYCRQTTPSDALFVAISQSGETADTLAALELAASRPYIASLAICNVAQSSIARHADYLLMTHAGQEVSVASTKAFTTQLVVLLLLVILLGKRRQLPPAAQSNLIMQLRQLPTWIERALLLEPHIRKLAHEYADKQHALFLGRGALYPIALEGALKMKEISYIHAEAYPAGELKHGPLALVDHAMPVVAVAPNDSLLTKLKSNLEEVRARHGILHVFADEQTAFSEDEEISALIKLKVPHNTVAPIIFAIPLQLLAYHTALIRGTNIDQPRNLAKSVTVE